MIPGVDPCRWASVDVALLLRIGISFVVVYGAQKIGGGAAGTRAGLEQNMALFLLGPGRYSLDARLAGTAAEGGGHAK